MGDGDGRTGLRILIAGGGTGGHVIPGLAIAREMRDRYGADVRFVGTARGLEVRLVPEAGFGLELIEVGPLKNVSLARRARTVADLPTGIRRCMKLLRALRPHVVVGVGGYASGPAMMAAILMRLPTLAYEPNATPGLANRIVGRLVSAAAVNFEESRRYFRKAVVTGVPVRREFFEAASGELKPGTCLVVTGGSQGAKVFNQVLPRIARSLLEARPGLVILHQTGATREPAVLSAYLESGADARRWKTCEFFEDMPTIFARATLVLCRSGASTVAELAAAGRPSLLVPFPGAADDHQRSNAEAFVRAGAGAMLLEAEMTPERLLSELLSLLQDGVRLQAMSNLARGRSRPDAVGKIAAMVRGLARV